MVRLWDRVSGRQLAAFRGDTGEVVSAVFSPDGRRLATGGEDGVIRVWDRATRHELFRLPGHRRRIEALAFAPDGKALASAGSLVSSPNGDGAVYVWDVETRRLRFTFCQATPVRKCLAFSPDGSVLAEAGHSRHLHLWDTATGRSISAWAAHNAIIESVAFSPDGRLLASCGSDGNVRVWDVTTRKMRLQARTSQRRVWCVKFSGDGKALVSTGRDGTVKVHDLEEILPRKSAVLADGTPSLSPEGGLAAALGAYSSLQLWDTATGKPVLHLDLRPSNFVAFSPDGRTLVSGTGAAAMLWDVPTGKPLSSPLVLPAAITAAAFSPDGDAVLFGGADGVCRLYDGKLACACVAITHEGGGGPSSFAPDGRIIATCGANGVRLWDRGTGALLGSFSHERTVTTVAFSPDGATLAVGDRTGAVFLGGVRTGQQRHVLTGLPTPSTRSPSPRTAGPWPPAAATARSGCGTSPWGST